MLLFFFFFQAEDGIRDLTVTGVQTCALPISLGADRLDDFERARIDNLNVALGVLVRTDGPDTHVQLIVIPAEHRHVRSGDDRHLCVDGSGAGVDHRQIVLDAVGRVRRVTVTRELDTIGRAEALDGTHDVQRHGLHDVDTAALLIRYPDVVRPLPVAAEVTRAFGPLAARTRLHADLHRSIGRM